MLYRKFLVKTLWQKRETGLIATNLRNDREKYRIETFEGKNKEELRPDKKNGSANSLVWWLSFCFLGIQGRLQTTISVCCSWHSLWSFCYEINLFISVRYTLKTHKNTDMINECVLITYYNGSWLLDGAFSGVVRPFCVSSTPSISKWGQVNFLNCLYHH